MTFHIGPYKFHSPWILAPMAGVSEMPFRVLALSFGAAAAPTELVSAKGLKYGSERTSRYLTFDPIKERPFWVQLFGGEIASMVEGACIAVAKGAQIIDINMGCPVKKVTKTGAGSGLLCDPIRAANMVAALVKEVGVPVTVKIRAGWDAHTLNYVEMGQRLEQAGCAAIAMHARTRAQGYSGRAQWSWIGDLVKAVTIPVFGNGDVTTVADGQRMLQETGCAGVMVGRASLGNPWIFAHLRSLQPRIVTPAERLAVIEKHFAAHCDFVGYEPVAVARFRAHLGWYCHGLVGAAAFRSLVMTIKEREPLMALVRQFFSQSDASGDVEKMPFDERGALG